MCDTSLVDVLAQGLEMIVLENHDKCDFGDNHIYDIFLKTVCSQR